MKISKKRLAQLIKEESRKVLNEGYGDYSAMVDDLKRNLKENDIDLWSEPEDQPGAGGGVTDHIHAARDVVKDAVQAGATREEMGALLKAVEAAIEYSFAGRG